MKKISVWAKHHVFYARIIIALIHLLLTLIAYYISLHAWFNFSLRKLSIVVAVLLIAAAIYPVAKQISYAAQKIILFTTSACFFLIVCFGMMHNFMLSSNQQVLSAYSLPFDTTNKNNGKNISLVPVENYKSLSRHDKKELRKKIKKQLKFYKKEIPKHGRPTGQDALLIFLIVLCGIALLFGLSILVCGISCGGVPGGVIVLTLLGMGGVGVALYFIIKNLKKNVDKERIKMDKSSGKNKHVILFPSV